MNRVLCVLLGHKWEFTHRSTDWLLGGEYYYICARCLESMSTKPYQGG